ncbi:VTT domain-containing protein [Lactococcus garvieae]|uniref:VTT domain-containing protein n=1 Tax=Lactococcus garvieae TaxID=1363 RepID=UPI0022E393C5|nr:DedA family protein [Lactococcus garvieae]
MFTTLSMFGFFNDWISGFLNAPGAHVWVYVLLGAIIFIETGLVIFPFLPGDSILFFVGSMAAMYPDKLSMPLLILSMGSLAFLANLLNYEIGRKFGDVIPKHKTLSKFLKPEYIEEAEQFFAKWGSWAIFLGRFMPIIRTVVPFTAGTSRMPHKKFVLYNFLGGFAWVIVALGAGFLFGQVPFIKKNFELVMLAIVAVSLLPAVIGVAKRYFAGRKAV